MSEYLDAAGVEKVWQAVKDRSVPVKTLTQAQYDALPYEERAKDILYVTSPFGTPSSAPASDVPIGAVIAVMGKTAPKDYLICDGAEHSIDAYPDLASYFTEQFGIVNHFGGDGTTTFAVPDLRNLFLRGYHGEAEEQLSGEIGVKQEATEIPNIYMGSNGQLNMLKGSSLENADSLLNSGNDRGLINSQNYSSMLYSHYTPRPVNTAVLYCIKASVPDADVLDVYSEEEQVIGKWIDGKPIYRKKINFENVNVQVAISSSAIPVNISDLEIDALLDAKCCYTSPYGAAKIVDSVCYMDDSTGIITVKNFHTNGLYFATGWYLLEYTKTSDTGSEAT